MNVGPSFLRTREGAEAISTAAPTIDLREEREMALQTEAKKLAEEALASSWTPGVFPVDPIAIAADLGVNVYSAFIGEDVSGMLRQEPGGVPEIFLDAYEPPVRRRFSCAHELGHFIRHASGDQAIAFVDYRGPKAKNGTDPEEVFANAFAANLLMPPKVRGRPLGLEARERL